MYGINILSQVHNKRLNVQYCQNISNEQKLFNVDYIRGLKSLWITNTVNIEHTKFLAILSA